MQKVWVAIAKKTENDGLVDCKQDFFQPASLNEDATLSLIRITISSKSQATVVKSHRRWKVYQARLKAEELSVLTSSLNSSFSNTDKT